MCLAQPFDLVQRNLSDGQEVRDDRLKIIFNKTSSSPGTCGRRSLLTYGLSLRRTTYFYSLLYNFVKLMPCAKSQNNILSSPIIRNVQHSTALVVFEKRAVNCSELRTAAEPGEHWEGEMAPVGTSSRMLGSGCGGLILHIFYSLLFLLWLFSALVVQCLVVSARTIHADPGNSSDTNDHEDAQLVPCIL